MRIESIQVSNFRILEDVIVDLSTDVTLIVGRNNSGKTSLTEVFYKFFGGDKSRFRFEDFSLSSHQKFIESAEYYREYAAATTAGESEEQILIREKKFKNHLPKITTSVYIVYEESDDGNLAALSNFLMDLDEKRRDALICCEYSVTEPERFFKTFIANEGEYKGSIIEFIRKNLFYFSKKYFSVDKEKPENRSPIENPQDIENVFLPRFVSAKINVDDQADDNSKGLSRGFEEYYKHNKNDDKDAEKLKDSLKKTATDLDDNYKTFFKPVFEDLESFGINTGVNKNELELEIKTQFEVEKVLKNNSNLFYKHDKELLPESYNGLGYSRLIFILLSILSYFEEQSKRKNQPNFSVLFIEEPEAHLHPQMQQTFIKNIREFIKKKGWSVQIVITTHSSHIVADSGFEGIRYFDKSGKNIKVKNLSEFKKETIEKEGNDDSIRFLVQYMTLYNCDMFFADKIILVEGTVERLLLPDMIRKSASRLNNQYMTIIEVGGAYALNFRAILEFINVKTLVITDIDCIDKANKRKAAKVNNGANFITSNQTLVKWLPKRVQISDLLSALPTDKTADKVRVAYQIPEEIGGACGRSFEEAFILKNAQVLSDNTKENSSSHLFKNAEETVPLSKEQIEGNSYEIAEQIPKKSDFAFDVLGLPAWEVPLYIKEGLKWLEQ